MEYSFIRNLYLYLIYAANNLGNECQLNIYVWVHSQSNVTIFCLKTHSSTLGVQESPFLEEMTFTHYIFVSVFFWSHLKDIRKVGVLHENLLIGNWNFFRAFYICWDYVISFLEHFPMKKFSPYHQRHRHQSPTNFLKFG